jgi:AbrB family looped-hinge helix DNA binding protein
MQTAETEEPAEVIDTVVVSGKGQVAIPIKMRNKLALKKGDKLVIALKDGKMLIMPARSMWKKNMENEFNYLLRLSEGSARELWDNKTDDLWNNI